MRAFFALDIDPKIQYAMEKWRDRAMLPTGRAVPAANFHITLIFLGDVTSRQLEQLCALADRINTTRFELCLDKPGYFPGAGIFWLGPREIPEALTVLADSLRKVSKTLGIKTSRKPFEPHITLLRNCHTRPSVPAPDPGFNITCDGFALFESITSYKGARYHLVHQWPSRWS